LTLIEIIYYLVATTLFVIQLVFVFVEPCKCSV